MAKDGYQKIAADAQKEKVSFVTHLFFHWMNSVFKTGNHRPLEETDFLPLSEENTSTSVIQQLQTEWNKEKAKCKGKDKRPKLWKSVLKMLSVKEVMILVLTFALYSLSRLLQPLLLGYFIASLMSADLQQNYLLYGCALAMGINAVIGCLGMHHFDYRSELLGLRFSSALKGLVYLKVSINKQKKS